MKKIFFYVFLFFPISLFFSACEDDNPYDDNYVPMGGTDGAVVEKSVYDYLERMGNFTYYLRLVNSVQDVGVNYAEVLKLTGTKTVFVANDEAYNAFFADNPYGIRSFEDFTEAQKRAILFSGMLDDAYLMEMLANTPGNPPNKGQALRRYSSWQVLDNVKFETADMLPKNPYWTNYKDQGIYILNDNSQWTMVHFLDAQMRANGITPMDFKYLTKTVENPAGMDWDANDAYIFNNKIVKKDVTCRNGYVNVMEQFRLPADNMSEDIRKNNDTKMFNHFMERFCAPYYDAANTMSYQTSNPDFIGQKLYVKRFFAQIPAGNSAQSGAQYYPNENEEQVARQDLAIPSNLLLKFDPGNNLANSVIQTDMGVIFAPTDEAFNDFFYNGSGKIMQERYGTWDNVPDNVMSVLLNNHMWTSFLQATPSRFESIQNSMGTSLNISPDNVIYTSICSNGIIYHVNKVYTPAEYASVYAPVIFGEANKIMYWAISELRFDLYLLSLENEFSFIVPTDHAFKNYISPISVGRGNPERWEFRYVTTTSPSGAVTGTVQAVRYNNMTGDSLGVITNTDILKNALNDIVDNHIIVGDIESGKTYYKTKGGAFIKVIGQGTNMTLDGGGNQQWDGQPAKVTSVYNQENGKTYLTDKIVQTPTNSVYTTLSDARFSKFFDLCLRVQAVTRGRENLGGGNVFVNKSGNVGITPNVSFFNTFNYTVYVPTNEAIEKAYNAGRFRMPDDIMADNNLTLEQKGEQMQNLYDFLRYHFQDNSVYIGGNSYSDEWFETATMNPETERFRRVYVTNNNNSLSVRAENGTVANVIQSGGLYNLMTRDYLFNGNVITSTAVTRIETSSFAVVHQIDTVLDFKP